MEKLESQRRSLGAELRIFKDRLQELHKTERFNENTGVGETKHGLSLGRLSVRLVEIQNLVVSGGEVRMCVCVCMCDNVRYTGVLSTMMMKLLTKLC